MASSPCGVPCTRSVSASRRGSDATWGTDTSPVPCCISRWAGRRWVPCPRGTVCEVPLVTDRGANHAARDRAGCCLAWQSSVQLSVGRLPCGATSGVLKRYNREACGARFTGGSVFWRRWSWLGSPLSNSVLVGCLVGTLAACATPCFCVGKGTGLVCASAAGWIFSFPACTLKVPSGLLGRSMLFTHGAILFPWVVGGRLLLGCSMLSTHGAIQVPGGVGG